MRHLIVVVSQALAALSLLVAVPAFAQWSSDPATNLAIADAVGEQTLPHVTAIPDGGFYVSWLSAPDGFDVHLQRLDADGNALWPNGGIVVADRDFQWVQDYGLAIDSMGRALLAYRQKDANGVPQIQVTEVNEDGTFAWNPASVMLTNYAGPKGPGQPLITTSVASMFFVAWMAPEGTDGSIELQKYNAYAIPQWSQPVTELPPSGAYFTADLKKANGSADVIMSWSAQLGRYDRELWAQKFAFYDGAAKWGSDGAGGHAPVKVYDGSDGEDLQYGYFPHFIADENGGAVFTWYTVGLNAATVRVQHLDAGGVPEFAQNGVKATTDTTRLHGFPDGAYDPATGNIFVLWEDADVSTQSHYTLYAQRVDSTGATTWGAEGKVLVPTSTTQLSQLVALPAANGDMMAAWVTGTAPGAMTVHASRMAANDGAPAWTKAIGTGSRTASRLHGVVGSKGLAAFVWEAGTGSDAGNIVAQNVYPSGTLGTDSIFKDGFDGQ